jgi:uncharacterized phage infection (PIP) family protein YhgE
MKNTLSVLLKHPSAKSAILVAFVCQIVFCIIWMTGYMGVTDNIHRLKIAIVNEDAGQSQSIVSNLEEHLPFSLETVESRQTAIDKLENRDVQLVVVLPANFAQQLQTPGQQAKIEYYTNESNAQMVKSIMQGVATNITENANQEALTKNIQTTFGQLQNSDQQAQLTAEPVISEVHTQHPINGMNNQMIPMMMVLASFVGAMIMQQNMQHSAAAASAHSGKWSIFGARLIINLVTALVISLIGSALVIALGGQMAGNYLSLWLFQSLSLLSFMFYSQVFLSLFGMPGMMLNIISLSTQLITSGIILPREMLSGFYHTLSNFLPATYAVRGMMNLHFGGPSAVNAAGMLILFVAVCVGIIALTVKLKKSKLAEAHVAPVE